MMKSAIVASALALGLSGCALVNGQITPTPVVSSDIQTAFTAICGPGGLLAAAAPFATTPAVDIYYNEAQTICANGVPANEITAGVDIFDLYLDLSQVLNNKAAMHRARALKARHT